MATRQNHNNVFYSKVTWQKITSVIKMKKKTHHNKTDLIVFQWLTYISPL